MIPALVSAAIVLVGNLIMVAFFSGRHAQRIQGAEDAIDDLKEIDQRQWVTIGNHGERISYVEAKLNGKGLH